MPTCSSGNHLLSPLRYPGGKRRLATYIAEVLSLNKRHPKLFVEPFAGGANVALYLASQGLVDKIALGERDPLVASFWKVAFREPDWLIEQIGRIPLTVDSWKQFRSSKQRSDRERALACLFLNRTSFSGILAPTAGPLGGYRQESDYPIGCRFNLDALSRRIKAVSKLSKQVSFIHSGDWIKTLSKVDALGLDRKDVFLYLDPPFFEKADRLYRFYFQSSDHVLLKNTLMDSKYDWLLSYDPAPAILDLYQSCKTKKKNIQLLYSTSATGPLIKAEEVIITSLAKLPSRKRLYETQARTKVKKPEGSFDQGGIEDNGHVSGKSHSLTGDSYSASAI